MERGSNKESLDIASLCLACWLAGLASIWNIPTPSFPVYKAYTYIKIQTFSSLTNNLTIKFLFL